MCMFCDIVKRQQVAYVVDETEKTMTILDIEPANEGHVLIIPKIHVDSIVNLPDAYVQEITSVTRRIIKAFTTVYHASGYGIMQNGGANCDFGHFHLHVFPRYEDDSYDWLYQKVSKKYQKLLSQN